MDSGKAPLQHPVRKERVIAPWVPPLPMEMKVGHQAFYIMSDATAKAITPNPAAPPIGAGERLPAVITAVNADGSMNLHVTTNGHGTKWVNNCVEGTAPGDWARTL